MTPVLSFCANHLWQSTLFAALVALLTLLLKGNRPAARYGLWLAASVKFLVPFALLIGLGSQFGSVAGPPIPAAVSVAIQQVSQPFDEIPSSATVVPTAPAASRSFTDLLPSLIIVVWLFGTLGVLARWHSRWTRVSAAVKSALPYEGLRVEGVDVKTSRVALEPGVVGIARPVLLLPAGIEGLLDKAQLDAVIAHESAHVRRRDNLAAAMHMIVEAIFWFHPLVWWIGGRLVDERERACDEEVLRLGNEPEVYAEGILRICEFYVRSPLACTSGITSSNLKGRVEEIMGHRIISRLGPGRKLILAMTGMAAIAVPLVIGALNAPRIAVQTQGPSFVIDSVSKPIDDAEVPVQVAPVTFEVASIKLNTSRSGQSSIRDAPGGRFSASNVTLLQLIRAAHGIQEFQVVDMPDWFNADRYDIEAKAETNVSPEQLRTMLQHLLADRFKLKFRKSTKEVPVLALIVGRNGAKLKAHPGECGTPASPPRLVQPAGCPSMNATPDSITGIGVTMEAMATRLSRTLGQTVVNKTNLEGVFDLELHWTADGLNVSAEPGAGSIYTAIQEQLGLRLETQKGTVETFVIQAAAKPSGEFR